MTLNCKNFEFSENFAGSIVKHKAFRNYTVPGGLVSN